MPAPPSSGASEPDAPAKRRILGAWTAYSQFVIGSVESTPPAAFSAALESIESANVRRDVHIETIPAPTGLAPWSFALAAEVNPTPHGVELDLGTGRLVLLHDPEEPDAWGGAFRIVCFAQAPLEPEIGADPFLADVAWSWLIDALDTRGAEYLEASGTATKIISTGFGELAEQGDGAKIELRASWTPLESDVSAHVEGWTELVCMLAGLPPIAEGVTMLSARRAGRG